MSREGTLRIVPSGASAQEGTIQYSAGGGVQQEIPYLAEQEAAIVRSVNALLPILPEPLGLRHGPLLVTVETWSDGTVVARLPMTSAYGDGDTDDAALVQLGESILALAKVITGAIGSGKRLAGPVAEQWRALSALVDVSALT